MEASAPCSRAVSDGRHAVARRLKRRARSGCSQSMRRTASDVRWAVIERADDRQHGGVEDRVAVVSSQTAWAWAWAPVREAAVAHAVWSTIRGEAPTRRWSGWWR